MLVFDGGKIKIVGNKAYNRNDSRVGAGFAHVGDRVRVSMATGKGERGNPGINWRGTFKPDVKYSLGDAVSYNGSSYIYNANITTENILPTSNTHWDLLAGAGGTVTDVRPEKYEHSQVIPETVWKIEHKMGRYPDIRVVDSIGREVEGAITYSSVDVVLLEFSIPISGTAYLI